MLHVMVTCLLTLILLLISLYGSAFSQPPWTSKDTSDISFNSFERAFNEQDIDRIKKIIDAGFAVNMQGNIGKTALTYVVDNLRNETFSISVSELLIGKGADVNMQDAMGRIPIIYAVEHENKALVEFLLEKGTDVALHCSSYNMPIVFVPFIRQKPELAYLFIARCKDVNIRDSIGNTPLSWAARFGYVDTVKLLLQKGANVNNASINNKTPLMEASEKGHYEIVELLIKSGASVNVQTKKGWSALMWTAEKGYIEIVSMLIEVDADLSARNNKGERALTIAQKNNHQETAKIIEEAETKKLIKKILFFSAIGITCTVLLFIAIKYFFFLKKKRGRHSVKEKE